MPGRQPRPAQRDVAALAGVSRATVSAVLNEAPRIRIAEATRRRVWAAAEELGFRPHHMARGLRAGRSDTMGLVTSQIATTPYAVAIIKGAQEAAFRHGKMLLIIDTDGATDLADEAIARLIGWRVEGLVIATDYHREIPAPSHLDATPTVLVNCFSTDPALPAIVPDERQGGRLATETLLAAGHRRIGFVNGPRGFPASAGRLWGYRDAHRAAGIPIDPRLTRSGNWWQESGAAAANALLDLDDPPTALFCANDWMAMGAYDAIKERGLRIPEDVAVIGFDNRVEVAAHLRPTLCTVALPYAEMGAGAIELLLAEQPLPRGLRQRVPCPLVPRGSFATRV